VRSSVYSGGASIDVSWVLGPTSKEVNAVAGQYESADFDGSIDMETRYDHWLLPDGSAIVKHGPGTEGSMGYIPAVANPMPSGAIPVSFGAHYVQCQRRYADQWEDETTLINQVAADMCKLQGVAWNGPNLKKKQCNHYRYHKCYVSIIVLGCSLKEEGNNKNENKDKQTTKKKRINMSVHRLTSSFK